MCLSLGPISTSASRRRKFHYLVPQMELARGPATKKPEPEPKPRLARQDDLRPAAAAFRADMDTLRLGRLVAEFPARPSGFFSSRRPFSVGRRVGEFRGAFSQAGHQPIQSIANSHIHNHRRLVAEPPVVLGGGPGGELLGRAPSSNDQLPLKCHLEPLATGRTVMVATYNRSCCCCMSSYEGALSLQLS